MENTNVLDIIAHTLSLIDVRLIDHGKNVALLTYNAMKAAGKYSDKEINDMCLIAVFHDIGAFKTDEITNLVAFDAENAWEHSVYGYLFIKHFSPLSYLAPVVLFHHTSLKYMDSVPEHYRELAQILHIADRMEIASRFGGMSTEMLAGYLTGSRQEVFSRETLRLFFEFENEEFMDHDELWHQLGGIIKSREDINEYLKMLVLSIDFRSRHTVNHTVATAEFSRLISNFFNFSPKDAEYTTNGALLHDLGKAGIPTEILENPGRLTDEEMSIMKTHVILTNQILKGRVNQTVEKIASRHHEKLNGSGYPHGLSAAQLSLPERIVAVADVLSALSGARSYKGVFPKDKVISILTEMAEDRQIDRVVVQKITENYDALMAETAAATRPVTQNYEDLSSNYRRLLEDISVMRKTNHFQFGSF
ncbi:MAG: HD domain-containing protein [Gracilibacteraceae bacterium]|jgi:putative nucleotidyltransferase with HDIG domain|nr:HD domain-containing protein [Gracilibacteraceae bacterium]